MSKQCHQCGATLPENAAFCPVCACSLVEKKTVKTPRLWRRKLFWAIAAAAVLVLAALLIVLSLLPQSYEGIGSVQYTDADGAYTVLICYPGDARTLTPTESFALSLDPGGMTFVPSMLCVHRDGSTDVQAAFVEKIETASVTIEAVSGEAMTCDQPEALEDFPMGALTSRIWINSDCEESRIVWTLKMKNGDTIRLSQTMIQNTIPQLEYRFDETPMETAQQLQDLIDTINAEAPANASIHLYLPAVTYAEAVTLPARTCYVYGHDDSTGGTVFAAPVTVPGTETQSITIFQNVSFNGSGDVGVEASMAVQFYGCTVSGWQTGILARDGGSVYLESCVLADNDVGLLFNTHSSGYTNLDYLNNTFRGNGTAIVIAALQGTSTLRLDGCVFEGNGENLRNEIDYPVDLSRAVEKS